MAVVFVFKGFNIQQPVVFVGECIEVFLFLMEDVLQPLVDRSAAVTHLLKHRLEDDHVTEQRILQHIDLYGTHVRLINLCDFFSSSCGSFRLYEP